MSGQLLGDTIVSTNVDLFNDANSTHILQSLFEEEIAWSTAPDAAPVDYRHSAALLISWTEDESRSLPVVRCAHEIEELGALLKDEFHMHVDVFQVPSKSPQLAVNSAVSRFILDHNNDDGLMVIYYGGHGFRKAGRSTKLMMTADDSHVRHLRGGPDPQFDWKSIEHLFDEVDSDVLEFLDCCSSGIVAREVARRHRRHEIFTSCGFSGRSPSPGENSFTTQMIEVMRSMLRNANEENKRGFDTRQLHLKLNDKIVQHNRTTLNSKTLNQSPIRFDRSLRKDGPIFLSTFRRQPGSWPTESGQLVIRRPTRSRTRSNSSTIVEPSHITVSFELSREAMPDDVKKLAKVLGHAKTSLNNDYVPIEGIYWSGLHKGSADNLSRRWRMAILQVLSQARSQRAANNSGPATPISIRSTTPDFAMSPDSQDFALLSPTVMPEREVSRRLSNGPRPSWRGSRSPSRSRSRGRLHTANSQSLDLGRPVTRGTQTDIEARISSHKNTGDRRVAGVTKPVTIQLLDIPDRYHAVIAILIALVGVLGAILLHVFVESRQCPR